MIIKEVNLETVCGYTSKLPDNQKPEIAFAGKSNVGKSSLINALMNRKSLARTSAQPGKTQTINFYNINDAMYFVDLQLYRSGKGGRAVMVVECDQDVPEDGLEWLEKVEGIIKVTYLKKAGGR